MKKFISSLVLVASVLLGHAALAAGAAVHLEKAEVDIHNQDSLQRGAKYFVNYCMGCHSLAFSRYNRVGLDAGLTDAQVQKNLIFTSGRGGELSKVGDTMVNGMRAEDVEEGFGAAPPDLSLVGRSRGADWIYSYLKAFYLDPSRPMGVNNTVLANAGMPHVLWDLQGWQRLEKDCKAETHGEHTVQHCTDRLVTAKPGKLSGAEYNQVVRDLTNFLVYVAEPAQLHRKTIGMFVLAFLVLFGILGYLLKKEYWKDVH